MRYEIRAFGGLAERAGLTMLVVELPEAATVGELRRAVAAEHPALAPLLARVAVAVDLELVDDATVLTGDEEIALLPPVAGGSAAEAEVPLEITMTGLVEGRFDVDAVLAAIGADDVGATVSFLGTVRDHAEDLDDVVGLEYSAYEAMAEQRLADIATGLRSTHPQIRGIALLHALGALSVGDHTILIAVSAPHRAEAFAACQEALEAVKAQVPVFKRELTAQGQHRWVGLTPSDDPPTPAG
jgi:MoaE-MoaD fusion protein